MSASSDSAGYWEAALRHELVVRVCRPAGHVLHLPRAYCATCDTFDVTWRPVAGRGTVHTWTVVEHAVDPAFPAPYTVVLVELDDPPGVRFVSDLPGRRNFTSGNRWSCASTTWPTGSRCPGGSRCEQGRGRRGRCR